MKKISEFLSEKEAALTSTHNLCLEQKYEKNIRIFVWKLSDFGGEIFNIFE